MENINRKQALRRALEEGGIFYVGAGADELNGKCCCLVLMRIASLLRADRLAAGVRAGAALLGGHIYSERQVFRGLAALPHSYRRMRYCRIFPRGFGGALPAIVGD